MTKFPSRAVLLCALLAGCAVSSGQPAPRIAEPAIAAAYRPLHARVHLGIDSEDGAATAIAPGIVATNEHNRSMVVSGRVIGIARDYDLLFFRDPTAAAPPSADPVLGGRVTAYGQGADADLRIAHGVVREIRLCPGCTQPAWFTFAGNAGPGFSGGPVVDGSGRLVGITFGYKDEGGTRLIYAYTAGRVRAELASLTGRPN